MKFKDAQKVALKMFSSPDFKKRIEEEDRTMLKHLNILTKINANGYLTTESQAGRSYKGLHYIDKTPYETKERAYMHGFMLEDNAAKFIEQIGVKTDKNAVFIPVCSNDIYLPSKLDIPLTITKKNGKTEVNTHTTLTYPDGHAEMLRKQVKLNKAEKVVMVFCWDTKWSRNASGSNGLFTDVLRTLQEI